MLKIGDFARLARVSIRMLRYYDEQGLLVPAQVDEASGYRYYAPAQLTRLYRILALYDMGFGRDQVAQLLSEDLPLEQLKGMLRLKQVELAGRVLAEQQRLDRVAARLDQIEHERQPSPYAVLLKELPPQLVASVRGVVDGYQGISVLFGELFQYLGQHGARGLTAALWHDDLTDERRIDAEALIYLREPLPPTSRVQVYELSAASVASLVHHGPLMQLNRAYQALVQWIASNQYQISGPNREIYIHYALPARSDDASYVTEIQFPVRASADG
jgi:DNA-binding transcriptional MerR regulator